MIKLIGLKRIVILVCVIALNLLVLGVYVFSVGPMLDGVQAQRDSLKSEIAGLHGRIAGVKMDTVYMKKNIAKYQALQDSGFFLPQNRLTIQSAMENLRDKSGVSNFTFNVGDEKEIQDKSAADIHYKLMASRISISDIASPLDANVYLLVQDLGRTFPAYVRVQSMDIHRTKAVDAQSLKAIAAGQPVSFVDASVAFEWMTMVPDKPAGAGMAGGFRRQ